MRLDYCIQHALVACHQYHHNSLTRSPPQPPQIRDLFNPKAGDNLKIRNNPKTGFYVEKLTRSAVGNFKMVEQLMEMGSKARTVASTQMNATSSRAHTIFQVVLTQTIVNRDTGKATDKTALINLIDLAGSERQSGTGATGARLKEGSAINLSLSSLGNCISALAHNASGKKKRRVPFRDSVLTMLLKNSLGGNAKTIMIAAVSPADINYDVCVRESRLVTGIATPLTHTPHAHTHTATGDAWHTSLR